MLARLARSAKEQRRWTEEFGQVRPIWRATFKGRHLVGVGSRVLWGSFETVPDFLDSYVGSLVGKEWAEAEKRKPLEERNPLLRWRYGFVTSANKSRAQHPDEKIVSVAATGEASAYFLLAWDLFTIEAFGKLQTKFVKRLKSGQEFQGVRHELFAMATLVRAGYAIEHHPKSVKSSRRTECDAVHQASGGRITMEAKSRHRHGVLGFSGGTPKALDQMRPEVVDLLMEALEKPTSDPLVIFLDLNLPPIDMSVREASMRDVMDSVDEARGRIGLAETDADRFAAIYVTNHPLHYRPGEPVYLAPPLQFAVFARGAHLVTQVPGQRLLEIQRAVEKFGRIPERFLEPEKN
jgi:hypothetical protein